MEVESRTERDVLGRGAKTTKGKRKEKKSVVLVAGVEKMFERPASLRAKYDVTPRLRRHLKG